ncbi:MAG: nicotinate-nucleotide--dimethylbenzimidazole phosphoribosyltransferase [Roseburia sp.]|nr:nicotinate-nucleotide--dimethylbenzimidazole phosphoribosyltransferase [Roseburia sp.]
MELNEIRKNIPPVNMKAREVAKRRWNDIAHPLHSLGKLEDYVVWLAGITGEVFVEKPKKALVVMCADNGVVAEGVTQTGQEVTAIMAENLLREKATAAILCDEAGAHIFPWDIGMAVDTKVPRWKVGYGTKNMAKEQAMTRDEALESIEIGIELARELKQTGYGLIAAGEMGIGNTTSSSAVASVLLGKSPGEVTGRGAGLTEEALVHKIEVIEQAIEMHRPVKEDAIDVLSKVGGFDLGGMTGLFLGGAIYQVPVVIDGFISAVSALLASVIAPECKAYMTSSHMSKEPGTAMVLKALGMEPALQCDMCLGEGTGAVCLFPLIDLAISVYRRMGTFEENRIEPYRELSK